jgi:hypothetical protein
VSANPVKDFKTYPNFSKLDLKRFSPATIRGGKYYLYSRNRVFKTIHYGYLGKDKKVVGNQNLLLLPANPKWDYFVNTDDIVLAYVLSIVQEQSEVAALPGSSFHKHWGKPKDVIINKVGDSTIFYFDKKKPFYIYTFPGKCSLSPNEHFDIFNSLKLIRYTS